MSHPIDFSRPSPFDTLPDHEYWTVHAQRSQSFSAPDATDIYLGPVERSASLVITPPKKLHHKLPPSLTESLEDLSRSSTISSSRRSARKEERPVPPVVPEGQHILSVGPPSAEFGANHITSSRASHRPSTASTTSIMSLRTPSGSIALPRSSISTHASPVSCSTGSASACGSWSILDEIEMAERASSSRRPKESRKERKARKVAEEAAFDVDTAPSAAALFEASLIEVIDEDGERVRFGDLYMNSILAEVSLDALEEADVDLVIIGNGSDKMLSAYRNKAFRCPFKMYTDPTLAVYRALGLTRKTGNAGPDEDKGDYLVQSALESTLQTLKRATIMPLRNPGHFLQLGGEFVFDGTLNVTYTHRMTTTRSHSPIRDVCAQAGVRLEFIHYEPGPPPPPVHRSSVILEEDEFDWREERDIQLARMREMKAARRHGTFSRKGEEGPVRGEVKIVGADGELEEEPDVSRRFVGLGLA